MKPRIPTATRLTLPFARAIAALTLALAAATPLVAQTTGNWNYNGTVAASNNWVTAASWTGLVDGQVPNAVGATVNFTLNITAGRNITLNGDKIVGTLSIDDPTSTFSVYTLSPGIPTTSRLIFDVASGSAALNTNTVTNTVTNIISAGVLLNDPLVINANRTNVTGGFSLTGVISDGDASLSITKNGNGAVTLANANEYDGGTIINGGRIQANNVTAMGTGPVTVASGGQWYMATAGTFANAVSLAGTGYSNTSDSAALLGAVRFQNSTITGNVTLTADTRIGAFGGTNGTIAGSLTGTGLNLEINSSTTNHNGNLFLTGNASGLTGTVTVAQGSLRLGTSSNLGGSVVVQDGAGLYGDNIGSAGGAVIGGNLTLGATTGANLFIDPSSDAALQVNGNVTSNGVTTVNLTAPPVASPVVVLTHTGTLTGGVASFALPGAPESYRPGTGFTLTGNQVRLNLVTENLKWTGAVSNNWDTLDANWSNGSSATFYSLDAVTFDALGAAYPDIVLPTGVTVTPGRMTFDTTAVDYQLGGAGAVAGGGTLTKNGIGSLTITNANAFTGGSTLNAGTIRLGNASGLGSGPITINNGRLSSNGTVGRTLSNPVVFNGTAILGDAVDTGAITLAGGVTLASDTVLTTDGTIGVNLTISTPVTDGAGSFRLTKTGDGNLVLGVENSYDGGTVVQTGRLQANNAGALGTGLVTVQSGAQVWPNTTGSMPNALRIEGIGWTEPTGNLGAIRLQGGINLTGNIELTGDTRITAHGTSGTLSGSISETGGSRTLELSNYNTTTDSTITVSGNNSYTGGTLIQGALVVANSSTAFGTGTVSLSDANPTRVTSVRLGTDVTIANDFVLNSSAPTNLSAINSFAGDNATVSLATVTGDIEVLKPVGSGGHLASTKGSASVLRVTGAITSPNDVSVVVRQGLVELVGGGNYSAMQIVDGTLRNGANNGLATNAVLNVGTSGTVGDTGTYDLNGFNQTLAGLLNNGVRAAKVVNTGATASTLTLNTPESGTYAGTFEGGTSLLNVLKTGAGTLTLTGNSSLFYDQFTVGGGVLNVTGTLGASESAVSVTAGGTLAGEGTIGGSLTFQGGRIALNGATPLGLLVNGIVNTLGGVAVEVQSLPATPEPIEVIAFNGGLAGTVGNFSLVNAGGFRNPQFQVNPNNVTLTFGAPATLTWSGAGGGTWDLGGTSSWVTASSAPSTFFSADNATFGNVGSGTVTVPSNVGVSNWIINSNQNWVFEGPGSITASSLTKDGTGSVDIATPWTISGPINLLAGSVKLGQAATTTGTIGGLLSGAGTLIKGGAGILSITQFNDGFSGSTIVSNGEISLGTESALGLNPVITLGDAQTLPTDIITLRLGSSGTLGNPKISVASTALDARLLSTGTTLTNVELTKSSTGPLYIGHTSSYDNATNFLTGTSTILLEKGNLAFTSRTPFPSSTPVTLGNLNTGNVDTVLEIPRAAAGDQVVMLPAITLGTLAEGATSQAILRYTGVALGTTSNGAPTMQGSINLNGRDLYLENDSPGAGGTSRLWNCAAAISGTGNVRIRTWANPDGSNNGAGRVRLQSAANSWTGDLYLDRGHVQIGTAAQVIPDAARILFSAGTAVTMFNSGETVRGLVGGAATESNPFPATYSINAGSVLTHTLTLNDAEAANTHVFGGVINNGSPAGSVINLVKNGAATQVFQGVSTYTGTTTVNGGTLEIGGAGQLGTGTYAANIAIGSGATLKVNSTADQTFQTGVVSGAGDLVKDNTGTLTLRGVNTFTGNITVNGGTLVGAGSQSGSGGVPVLGSRTNTRTFTVNAGATLQFDSGNITGSGYNQTTAPTLVINGGTVTNGGIATNSALNNVVLDGGTLTSTTGHVGSSSGIPVYGAWNLNGTVTSSGTSTISTTAPDRGWVMMKVIGDTTTEFNVTDGTLTVSAPMVDNPTDGNIGSMRKTGAGTMLLTAANTYRGLTTVSQGTLAFAGGSQTAPVVVEAGASLAFTLGAPTTSTGTFDLSAGTIKIIGTPTLASHDLIVSSAGITGTPTLDAPVPGYELKVDGTSLKLVQSGGGYSSWASLNGAGTNLAADHDNDGVPNGVEYFLGGPNGTTTGFTALPGVLKDGGGLLTVTWPKGTGYTGTYGTDFVVETSTTLSGPWSEEAINVNVVDSPASVIFTFPGGPAYTEKRFVRLRVVGP